MKCEICKEEEATHLFQGMKCCYECMDDQIRDNCTDEAIDEYKERHSRTL